MGAEPSSKSSVEKLGVRPGLRESVLGLAHPGFTGELAAAGADVSERRRKDSDLIFVAVERTAHLARLGRLEPFLRRNGAVWAVFPKGRRDLREIDVIRTGVGAGLVDNKVVRFSETHTALRFVVPLARR